MLDECKQSWQLYRLRSGMLRLPLLLGKLSVPLLFATGCQSTKETPFLGTDFCAAAKAIYYSRHDTKPTIAQIKEHNAVGVALRCGWVK
jgi:hypothetical protein